MIKPSLLLICNNHRQKDKFSHLYREQNIFLVILFCWLMVPLCSAQNNLEWKLYKQKDSIKISYQVDQTTGLNRIKAEAKLRSSLSGFMWFLQDYQHIPDWLDNANKSELLQQITPQENIFVTYFDGFLWVKPRHLIVHSVFKQQDDLTINIEISPPPANWQAPNIKNSLAMQVLSGHWTIKPLSAQDIYLSYQVLVDPKGNIPRWLANQVALSRMYQTLKNIQQQLPKSPGQALPFELIKNR